MMGIRKYYTIGELAKMFGVSTSLVRYWEKKFKQLQPQTQNGIRRYTDADIEKFKKIFILIKEKGYTLRGAQITLKATNKAGDKKDTIIRNLESVKSFLETCYQQLK
jgi:DNA-binding transcriptional MerR regulator